MKEQRLHLTCLAFIALSITFTPRAVKAGTCVSGSQSGTWSLAGSPYIISNTLVTVDEGSTLTIEPGVVVMLKNGSSFTARITVRGALIARDVTFTGADEVFKDLNNPTICSATESRVPGTWGGIGLSGPEAVSLLENCKILYGGSGRASITQFANNDNNTNVTISNCLIAFGENDGIWLQSGASPTILNSTIQGHGDVGIFHNASNCEPMVVGCAIIDNDGYAVRCFPDNVKNYSDDFISGNHPNAFNVVGGGDVSTGTWQDHGGPYHVVSSTFTVRIPDGETLTLEPGVELLFGVNRGFNVFGTLVADGDSCRHITFSSLDTTSAENNWGRIALLSSDAGTILDYCDISYGGWRNSEMIAIRDVGTNVVISRCRITNSDGPGLEAVIVSGTSEPFIFNNLIADNAAQGINVISGAKPFLRNNLITGNLQGVRLFTSGSSIDLGTVADPGHNAFVNNTDWAILSNAADTTFAVGNFWMDTDSARIDTVLISDDDESTGVGPVVFTPFDTTDRSMPQQPFPCPPFCQALSVAITSPTSNPTFITTASRLNLGGTAMDDVAVSRITWENTTTGATGAAILGAPRTNLNWTAELIPLIAGDNIITLRAFDQDSCTATDDVVVTFIDQPGICWELDDFNDVPAGSSLNGRNGWFTVPGRSDAFVVANPVGPGNVLQMDAGPNETVIMGKFVNVQTSGIHSIKMNVLVLGDPNPAEPTLAKVEIRTTGNPDWDKKFQLYFGDHMRLNFGPTLPQAEIFLPADNLEEGRWYEVEAVVSLDRNLVDVFLDGELKLDNITVGPGPITDIGISAWDRKGIVYYDDLSYCRLDSLPVPQPCTAASFFDLDGEGWTIVGQGGSTIPDHFPTDGNPNGYISATNDTTSGTWFWVAPSKFLGDASCAYGRALNFDLRQSTTSNQFDAEDIILEGSGTTLIFDTPDNPGMGWTSYSILLLGTAGWKKGTLTGDPPTQEEMQAVLDSLERLWIRGEYTADVTGSDLDNVVLNGMPKGVGPLRCAAGKQEWEEGDGDGRPEAGELFGVSVVLANDGIAAATGVTGILTASDPDIGFSNSEADWPDLAAGASATSRTTFDISVSSDLSAEKVVTFSLTIMASNGGPWVCTFDLPVFPENLAPSVLNPIPDTTLFVGDSSFVRDLNAAPAVFDDPDQDLSVLSYTVTSSDTNKITATIEGSVLTLIAKDEGTESITVTANDGRGGAAETSFTVVVDFFTSVASPNDTPLLTDFRLYQNYPNPFLTPHLRGKSRLSRGATTTFYFDVPSPSEVKLTIYDILGKEVKTLVEKRYQAGTHSTSWDGRDNDGHAVGSGLYIVQMRAGDFVAVKKMALTK